MRYIYKGTTSNTSARMHMTHTMSESSISFLRNEKHPSWFSMRLRAAFSCRWSRERSKDSSALQCGWKLTQKSAPTWPPTLPMPPRLPTPRPCHRHRNCIPRPSLPALSLSHAWTSLVLARRVASWVLSPSPALAPAPAHSPAPLPAPALAHSRSHR